MKNNNYKRSTSCRRTAEGGNRLPYGGKSERVQGDPSAGESRVGADELSSFRKALRGTYLAHPRLALAQGLPPLDRLPQPPLPCKNRIGRENVSGRRKRDAAYRKRTRHCGRIAARGITAMSNVEVLRKPKGGLTLLRQRESSFRGKLRS